MAMTIPFEAILRASSSGLFMSFGRFTVTPCCNKGVTTMKMINSTSMISTIGVTLISELRPLPPAAIPIAKPLSQYQQASPCDPQSLRIARQITLAPPLRLQLPRSVLDKVVNQLRSRVIHLDDEPIDL